MKRIILFLTVCLGLSVFQTTFADDANTVRAANKRTSTNVSAQQSTRSVTTKRSDNTKNSATNTRTAQKPQTRTVSRTTTTAQKVKPRETAATTNTIQKRVSTTSRTASNRAVSSRTTESKAPTRTAVSAQRIKRISRATDINNEKIQNIKSLNYSKCKTVYYECMDEFCANKDTNLRRCACSARIHEFDNIKKQLSNAEDKMLDFNQRLLTVNLDKEDAAAINVATDGELGYQKKDTTESERLLQKITDSLNSSGDSKINNDLSSISLSLNMDTAWDDVDSMSGVATSAKSGTDLYNAAQPVCIEMAREVCTDDELDIAQSGYKLTIQQDCDTVAKSYKTQYNTAMEKIHESSALLDISRLNVHQQRNNDDTLTCKKKILNKLTESSVCGENLYKCLDTTGEYIDPSTGKAFLSENLPELANVLQEPTDGEKWSKIPQNEKFVNFLNSKKKFLESATEQCQNISDMIWQDFLDDALAQIKLAQNAKLEEIKRDCTNLVSECKTNALQSLSDFDARTLSTFSINADKTANQICSDVETACSTLMSNANLSVDWKTAMSKIATDETYQKIIDACTTVGRDCIVQQCNGTSGNFALCQKVTDANRRAILNREACWDKVLKCVENADNLTNMNVADIYSATNNGNSYWSSDTSLDSNLNDVCDDGDTACYISKQIWGTCEYKPNLYNITTNESLIDHGRYQKSNKILMPNTGTTLLSWFAENTGTAQSADSCNSIGCPINYAHENGVCKQVYTDSTNKKTSDCGTPTRSNQIINVTDSITNYCGTGVKDIYGNCCANNSQRNNGICVPGATGTSWQAARLWNLSCDSTDSYFCPAKGNLTLYCVTQSTSTQPIVYYTDSGEYACGINADGKNFDNQAMWIIVDENGNYFNANPEDTNKVSMYYNKAIDSCPTEGNPSQCTYTYSGSGWVWNGTDCTEIGTAENQYRSTGSNELFIKYPDNITANQP